MASKHLFESVRGLFYRVAPGGAEHPEGVAEDGGEEADEDGG